MPGVEAMQDSFLGRVYLVLGSGTNPIWISFNKLNNGEFRTAFRVFVPNSISARCRDHQLDIAR